MKPYKLIGKAYTFAKNKFQEMEDNGLIRPTKSEWGTAIMCVPKDSKTEEFRVV